MNAPQNLSPIVRYRDSGVNIDAGNELVSRIKPIATRTHGKHAANILGGLGGFGALYELPLAKWQNPVLVSATDGVGSKLKLAAQMARDTSIGIDLVAMCVNDIIACGAEPLCFLDYFASGVLDLEQSENVIKGIARGCELAGCALVGGETAEMPGLYASGEYELAGFAVGMVDKKNILDGSRVQVGDKILGLGSSGPHANGFSLIRKIIELSGADLAQPFAEACSVVKVNSDATSDKSNQTLADVLLTPTHLYVKPLLQLLAEVEVSAIAHITGGGLLENPPRVLPTGTVAEIHRANWPIPPVFQWLQRNGNIEESEMLRTFNCGIGMVVVVRPQDSWHAISLLQQAGETVFSLGQINSASGPPRVVVRD